MKKIGILTYWGVANYGAWTQAYALNKTIQKMYPNDSVQHIAYLEQSHWDCYYKKDEKGYNCFSYNWDEIPHTCQMDENKLENEPWDVLITGADSIWEEILTGVFKPDWHLVGNGLFNVKKLIAYAPSSGIFSGNDYIPQQVATGLKKYDAISARDDTTRMLVKKTIGKEVPVVLDPALLWDFSLDINVKKTCLNKYIAVYGANWNPGFIDNVKKYAKERKLKLISIGFINEWCDISFRRNELRALEWIGMIAYAECIVTSTFHGLMMGLNYRKPIKFCQVDYVKNRSQTLLEMCGVPNNDINFQAEINYGYTDKKLKEARNYSLDWLKKAID